ncbi:GDP-mannose 4,6-dehydratase [Candidatus Pelagibacter ubique]|nr:GDP-mannose 4,6-dehydratase [Candidatus Pelagibacter ubique]
MRVFKKALITGISGSGGSYLAEYIINNQKKTKVFGIYRSKTQNLTNTIKKNSSLINCDLNNYNKILQTIKKIKPDVIFHLASNADVKKSFDYPREIINNNNNCTLNLLEAIRESKINPIIQICSTSEVYGMVNKKETPIKETNPFRPASPYAVSKTFQDLISQNYHKNYGLRIIITRMFTYLNPRRTNLFASHWADQVSKIEKGKLKILKHGNLKSTRTIIDIEDAMRSYWVAATNGKVGEIYNIGGNKIIEISEFLKILKKKAKVKILSKVDKNLLRKTDVTLQIPDVSKFKKHTKWKPTVKFENSVNSLLNEFRKKNT